MEIKLSGLVNKTGIVIEDLSDKDRKSKGYMVQLHSSFLEEYLWFIPIQSVIEYEPTI